ncbi:MAG: GNAT family N-acetyltransferase [Hyphomicrobiaceae bacterium]
MAELQIKTATPADFSVAIDWAAAEGWNPGLDDLGPFHAADPEGFLMAYLDDEPVASVSVVRYGDSYGFLGFYIVKPESRGQGYGWQIWQAGLRHLSNRVVGLDGVVAQQDNYRKSGFDPAGRNVRYTGALRDFAAQSSIEVQSVAMETIDKVIGYDRQFFPDDRKGFMRQWLQPSSSVRRWSAAAINGTEILGFGVVRQCHNGYKFGPLFAERQDIAESLLSGLGQSLPPGTTITIDVPEDNRAAIVMVESYGLEATSETARMYKGLKPSLPIERTFGVTTFELG